MAVAVRFALRSSDDPELGSLAMSTVALLVTSAIALVARPDFDLGALWPFLVAGAIAPGLSQILFVRAVREAGAARTSVLMGTAPLVAVAIALTVLGEPVRAAILAGAGLIVAGGFALANERVRPADFRRLGVLFAVGATVLFAVRDNVLRAIARDTSVDALVAVPAGLLFVLSYTALFQAYYRGRVSVVAPLVATESLWGVAFAALLLRRTELVGRRLVAGALLIVAGGVLIGVSR